MFSLENWPHEIAQTLLKLGELSWKKLNGVRNNYIFDVVNHILTHLLSLSLLLVLSFYNFVITILIIESFNPFCENTESCGLFLMAATFILFVLHFWL